MPFIKITTPFIRIRAPIFKMMTPLFKIGTPIFKIRAPFIKIKMPLCEITRLREVIRWDLLLLWISSVRSNLQDVVDMVLYIIGTFQPSASSLIGQETGVLPQRSKGRQLCLLPLVDSEIFSYCVHLLIACLKVQQYVRGGYCPTLSNCETWWPVVGYGSLLWDMVAHSVD